MRSLSGRWIAISLCLSALARPAAAVFPTIVQTVCDPDFPGCVSGVSGLDGARGLALSPDDKHVYVCSGLDDALLAFARNTVDGTIAHVQTILDTDPGINGLDACRGVAVSPDGKHVYTAGLLDDALAVWSRNAATGALTLVEVELDNSGGVDGLDGATSAAVSPDGKHVYGAAVFRRNTDTSSPDFGKLTFLQALKEEAFGPYTGCNGVGPEESGVVVSPEVRGEFTAVIMVP